MEPKMVNDETFQTESLPVAAYIHASRSLKFIGCKPSRPGIQQFLFFDPDGRGSDLEFAFDNGAKVGASAMFSAVKFLRTEMSKSSSPNINTGAPNNDRISNRASN